MSFAAETSRYGIGVGLPATGCYGPRDAPRVAHGPGLPDLHKVNVEYTVASKIVWDKKLDKLQPENRGLEREGGTYRSLALFFFCGEGRGYCRVVPKPLDISLRFSPPIGPQGYRFLQP